MQKICVLGLGYIGLPTAAMFATHGYQVLGVDVNKMVIDTLNKGEIHIEEPGLKTLVKGAVNSDQLKIGLKPAPSDVYIIAVPTPITEEKKADMSYVVSAARSIVPVLEEGNLVILEATSPPRTTIDLVQPILEEGGLKGGEDFLLAYSPERVLPGKILNELVNNSRVIGGINQVSAKAGQLLYSSFVEGEIMVTDSTTAEMVKLMENTYRDINIAAANEFSRLAEYFGIDVWEAIDIANLHPRVEILKPGPGVGGHCISVDPWFFVEKAPHLALLIKQAREVNDSQPAFVIQLLKDRYGSLKGKSFAALGITYKPDVDDIRESPAIDVIERLVTEGAVVKAYDPYLGSNSHGLDFLVDGLEEVLSNADGILLLVNHSQFKELNPSEVLPLLNEGFILDTRNVLLKEDWIKAGFEVKTLGDK